MLIVLWKDDTIFVILVGARQTKLMSSTKAEIDLRNCEIAFRNAGLYSAYMQLELNIILAAPLGI